MFAEKTYAFASNNVLTYAKHSGIRGKTFAVQGKTAKVLSLGHFVKYGTLMWCTAVHRIFNNYD